MNGGPRSVNLSEGGSQEEETATELTVKVLRKKLEAKDVASFELVRPDRTALPSFSPGSHIDVHIPGGFVRQYSLSNPDREQHRYRIAVLRDSNSRGGSTAMHDKVGESDLLTISAPRNHFPLVNAHRTILLAGGIGITPLMCMAQAMSRTGVEFALHYCTRSPDRTAFRDELLTSKLAANTVFHFDDGDARQKLQLAKTLGRPEPGSHVYVCGPTGFIEYVLHGAKAAGFSSDQIHLEYFGTLVSGASSKKPFQVKIASTGQLVTVPEDQTVVQALAAVGYEIVTSCEQGVCGTCITRVLEGQCDHRDLYFTDEEKAKNDRFTPCCSRASSAVLTLDL